MPPKKAKKKAAKPALEVEPLPYKKGDVARVYVLIHRGEYKAVMSYRDEKGPRRKYKSLAELPEVNKEVERMNKEARKYGESFRAATDAEVTALKAYRDYVKRTRRNHRQPVPILTLMMRAITEAEAKTTTPTFEEVRESYLDHLSTLNRSPRHHGTQESRLKCFAADFGGVQVGDIAPAAVQAAITRIARLHSPKTVLNKKVALYTLFSYCVKQGIISANPAENIETPALDREEAPEIITVQAARRILQYVRESMTPGHLSALVLALFCGVRRAEIVRIKRGFIDLDRAELTIPRAIAKRRQARYIKIPSNAVSWLREALAGVSSPEVYILPGESEHARNLAYQNILRRVERRKVATVPANAFRHSAASYMCAVMQDLPKVALQLGHSVDILNQHYRNVVTERDGKAWFAIKP